MRWFPIALVVTLAACSAPPPEDPGLVRPVDVVAPMSVPVLRYTRCIDALAACQRGGFFHGSTPLLACLKKARVCTPSELTLEPPNGCCPRACVDLGIASGDNAWSAVFSHPHACFPGAAEGLKAWEAENKRLHETVNRPRLLVWEEKLKAARLEEERRRAERVAR